jgi:hypothetical protein
MVTDFLWRIRRKTKKKGAGEDYWGVKLALFLPELRTHARPLDTVKYE